MVKKNQNLLKVILNDLLKGQIVFQKKMLGISAPSNLDEKKVIGLIQSIIADHHCTVGCRHQGSRSVFRQRATI